MNRLITLTLEENDASYLVRIPREVMDDLEVEMVDFILDFSSKHDELPNLGRFMEKFEYFIPYVFAKSKMKTRKEPLSLVFEDTLKKKIFSANYNILKEIRDHMKDHKETPTNLLEKMLEIQSLGSEVHRYSSFDRKGYFTRKTINLPFKLINETIGGLGTVEFLLLTGRLGTSKSTQVQFIAVDAWEQGKKVLFVSPEMNHLDVFARVDGFVGGFNPSKIRRIKNYKRAKKELFEPMEPMINHKSRGEIIVPSFGFSTPSEIQTLAKNLDVDLIIVDACYLLQPNDPKISAKHERMASISNSLKKMAMTLKKPVIATTQIKRGASDKDVYDPEDIGLSDAFGQDADFIVAIKEDELVEGRYYLQLIKSRQSSNLQTQIFIDWDHMKVIEESVVGQSSKAKAAMQNVNPSQAFGNP